MIVEWERGLKMLWLFHRRYGLKVMWAYKRKRGLKSWRVRDGIAPGHYVHIGPLVIAYGGAVRAE